MALQKKWQKQEKRVAKFLSGKQQLGSGSKAFYKSDVLSNKFRVECKQTDKESISLKKAWLDKVAEEALAGDQIPAVQLEIGGRNYWVFADADIQVNKDGTLTIGEK